MEFSKTAISQFADTCGIPRPTMSQILNGRNKKISDELISKIHSAYPQLSVLWLMFGEGEMLTSSNIQASEAENTPVSPMRTKQSFKPQTSTLFNDGDFTRTEITQENNKEEIGGDQGSSVEPEHSSDSESNATSNASANYMVYNPITTDGSATEKYGIIDFESSDINRQQSGSMRFAEVVESKKASSASDMTQREGSMQSERRNEVGGAASKPSVGASTNEGVQEPAQNISLKTCPGKHITNIVVFYSDNSFQSFYPEITVQ